MVLSPILGLGAIPFWIGSVLIDTDHYLEFIYINKFTDFSIKRMYDYHNTLGSWFSRPEFLNLSIFHTVEFLSLSYILAVWVDSPILKATLLGMLFHVLTDIVSLTYQGVITKRAHSIIEFFIRKRHLIRHGLHPKIVCNDALQAIYSNTAENKVLQ